MNILVVGFGSIGQRHARNLQSLGHLVGVVEPHASRRDEAQKGGLAAFPTLEAGLAAGGWTAAVIATPTAFHVRDGLAAARAGLHLFMEKPVSHDLTGLRRLEAEVASRGLVAVVGFNLRFHPAVRKAAEMIHAGRVGRLLHVRAEYGNFLPSWRPSRSYQEVYSASAQMGGGILLDASHELDYVSWFAGPARAVSARLAQPSSLLMDADSVADLSLEFESGAVGQIHLDALNRKYTRSFAVVGESGTLSWSWGGDLLLHDEQGKVAERVEAAGFDFNETYVREMTSFIEAVEGKAPPVSPLSGARVNMEMIRGARRSSLLRREISLAPFEPIVAIVQARMGSTRLPNKSMLDVAGKPLLLRVLERARAVPLIDEVVVATTTDPGDNVIEEGAVSWGYDCVRGSAEDVLSRYALAARASNAAHVVRLTADDPLKDPAVTNHVIATYLGRNPPADYAANNLRPSYPEGMDVEVFSRQALQRALKEAALASEHEHVTPYIWKSPDKFHLVSVEHPDNLSDHRWTVDHPEDLEFVRKIYSRFPDGHVFSWQDVLDLLRKEPSLVHLTTAHPRSEGYLKSIQQDRPMTSDEQS